MANEDGDIYLGASVFGGLPVWVSRCGDRRVAILLHLERFDVEHPSNHGHLLALVCKAYPERTVEITVHANGSATVEIRDGRGGFDVFQGAHLGLALAAALLAAPPCRAWTLSPVTHEWAIMRASDKVFLIGQMSGPQRDGWVFGDEFWDEHRGWWAAPMSRLLAAPPRTEGP